MPATRESDPRPAAPRRSRTKTRKPKFLSLLRIDLSATSDMAGYRRNRRRKKRPRRQQQHRRKLNLFPRRPDTAEDDPADDAKDPLHYDENVNVNLLFNGDDDSSPTTLNGLLDDAGAASPVACSEECSIGSRDSVPELRDSTGYGGGDHPNRSSLLVRAAMKRGGRDVEEKWVSYSEVVERKPPPPPPLPDQETEEVSSCSAAANSEDGSRARWPWRPSREAERSSLGGLLLKLDYEDILNSWSHKGSLFINDHEAAQTVPDINNEFRGPDSAINNGLTGVWTVPDQNGDLSSIVDEKEGRFRHREASVLRYKEKRQNRLFAKRIRYEVRKLNAEKRPRIKGRFVRSCKDD